MPRTNHNSGRMAALTLAALGVVYGDIGTSPLYAVRECFYGEYGVAPDSFNVLGVLSLITWSLLLVISVKYLVFVLRADYDGEGGILALMELVRRRRGDRGKGAVLMLGLFGAALLYGDGMITPAISVLSAIEGLDVVAPAMSRWVVPATLVILVALFAAQRLGTAGVGRLFGPVMLLWFAALGTLGVAAIMRDPDVLAAVDPRHGLAFIQAHGRQGLMIVGIVFLVVTGGEALYADIGHLGTGAIRLGWYGLVLPALLLNYFGQGALILGGGPGITNPFYQLVPAWGMWPMVVLATVATIIASQAIITGVFSLTFQAIQLGYLPRLALRHTSAVQRGQIYIPAANWLLLGAVLALVLGFGSSGALASAYGVAISTTMVITTFLLYLALQVRFGWPMPAAGALCLVFLVIDLAFFGANILKFLDGGWVPLAVAGLLMTVMLVWRSGRRQERRHIHDLGVDPVQHLADAGGGGTYRRVPGVAVYLTENPRGTPRVLAENIEHNHALHRQVVLLTVTTVRRPWVADKDRLRVEELRGDIHRVVCHLGFMEEADVPGLLEPARREAGLDIDFTQATYFVGGRFRLPAAGLGFLRSLLYAFLARNQHREVLYYNLPPDRVVELGQQVKL